MLAQAPGLRDRMVLATKGGIMPPIPYDSSDAYLRSAVEASLGRLGVDVIDLYQIHRPDMFAHPAQVAETLSSLVGEGKIRAVGVSNHTPAQHDALIAHLGDLPLATSQPEYSPAFLGPLRDGTFDLCMRDGIVPLAWSPLGGGRLMSGENVPAALIATLDELAEREGVDRAAICYAFVLAHPSAPVALLGTQNPDRLRAAVAASMSRLIGTMSTASSRTAKECRSRERPRGNQLVRRPVRRRLRVPRRPEPRAAELVEPLPRHRPDGRPQWLRQHPPAIGLPTRDRLDRACLGDRTHTEQINLLLAVRIGEMWLRSWLASSPPSTRWPRGA